MKYFELRESGAELLKSHNIDDAEFDAAVLLEHIFSMSHTEYCLNSRCEADPTLTGDYMDAVSRRAFGEPLQYIIGKWSFFGRDFFVGKGVLIPRPETEELVELALGIIEKKICPAVFDLCSGSGCIAVTAAKERNDSSVTAFEKSPEAFSYLKKNIKLNDAENVHAVLADIFEAYKSIDNRPDLIVSNPPYIESDLIASLQNEVQREPSMALDGGTDGLDFYRLIADKWFDIVKEGGAAAIECGEEQAKAVAEIFVRHPRVKTTEIKKDLQEKERFVLAFLN